MIMTVVARMEGDGLKDSDWMRTGILISSINVVYRSGKKHSLNHLNYQKRHMSCVITTKFSHINMRSRSVFHYDLKT